MLSVLFVIYKAFGAEWVVFEAYLFFFVLSCFRITELLFVALSLVFAKRSFASVFIIDTAII